MYPSLGNQFSSNININFNFNAGNAGGVSDLLSDISALFESAANLLEGGGSDLWAGNSFQDSAQFPSYQAPIQPPIFADSSHPAGSLKSDGNTITTPGGYKIESLNQFEWKITGPDGKETKVWGDPHVAEGDGGKWDFKKDSTFVLGDGTKINVSTAPYGNGMTVTSKLEIISGNDRVEVTDIDKGKGKIGQVTQDGYAHANSFQGDVFVMGQETDDWSIQGKEIIGSNNGGESFQTGKDLKTRDPRTFGYNPMERMQNNWLAKAGRLMSNLFAQFNSGFQPNRLGSNFYAGNTRPLWEGSNIGYSRPQHRQGLANGFRALAKMYDVMARLASLSERVQTMRQRQVLA